MSSATLPDDQQPTMPTNCGYPIWDDLRLIPSDQSVRPVAVEAATDRDLFARSGLVTRKPGWGHWTYRKKVVSILNDGASRN